MGFEVRARVWRESRAEGSGLLVLLALADSANADGRCDLSVRTLAGRVGLHHRQVRRILRQLVQEREVDVVPGGSQGVPNQYRLRAGFAGGHPVRSAGPGGATQDRAPRGDRAAEGGEAADESREVWDGEAVPVVRS